MTMEPHAEGDVLSRIEFVLPKHVLQTAYHLSSGLGATFMSTNLSKRTATHIKLFKRTDESVSVNCTVRALNAEQMHQPEHVMIDQVKNKHGSAGVVAPEPSLASPPYETIQTLLDIANVSDGTGGEERKHVVLTHTSTSNEAQVISPEHRIPESLLAHDDVTSPNKTQQDHTEKQLEKSTPEVDDEKDTRSEQVVKSPTNTKQSEEKSQTECENKDVTSPIKKVDKLEDDISESPAKRLTRQSKISEGSSLEGEKVNTRSAVKAKNQLKESVKQKSSKFMKEALGDSKSPRKQVSSASSPERSPRRPRRTSQLPARLAESEVFMNRKRPSSSSSLEDTPKKRVKVIEAKDTPEKSDEAGVDAQELEEEMSSPSTSLTKPGKKRKSKTGKHKESKAEADSEDNTQNEKDKAKAEKTLACPVCKKLMREYENVFDHVKKKHEDNAKFEQHLTDLKEKMKATCHICGKEISRPSAMKMHIETMHTDLAEAKCEECGAVLKSKRHLELHMKRCHLETKQLHLCHLCPASFKVKQYLVTHIKNVHCASSKTDFKCDQCPKTFSTDRYMKTHKLRVHGPKKFSCPHCSMGFSEPPNLRRHVKLIHETPKQKCHFCPQCDKGFTLQSNLKEHIQTIHLRKYPFQCDQCAEGFSRRKQLEVHRSESHRTGACFKPKRGSGNSFVAVSKDNPGQMIEIHPQGTNVFTVHTVSGDIIEGHNIQTIDGGSVLHAVDGSTIQTIGDSTIVQTVDNVGAVQTIGGGTDHIVEVPTHAADGSSVAIRLEEGATDESVQFCIVATPEMLEAFGLQDENK